MPASYAANHGVGTLTLRTPLDDRRGVPSCPSSLAALRGRGRITATRDHVEQIRGGHDSDDAVTAHDRERTRALPAQERDRFRQRRIRHRTSQVPAHHVFHATDTFGLAKFELVGRYEPDHVSIMENHQVMNSRVRHHGPRARDQFAALDRADVSTHHVGDPHHALPSPHDSPRTAPPANQSATLVPCIGREKMLASDVTAPPVHGIIRASSQNHPLSQETAEEDAASSRARWKARAMQFLFMILPPW